MSHVLDRYGGDRAWDLYCDAQDAAYERLIEGKTCLDCDKTHRCDRKGHESVGYCSKFNEFVTDEDKPKEMGLDCYEEAA